MKNLEQTIEFFTPQLGLEVQAYIAAKSKQGIHHVGRYQWACRALAQRKPKRVLDVACGAGYGSYMLALAMPDAEIVGGDYDRRAVDYAVKNYKAANLTFAVTDVVTWQFENLVNRSAFDAIVSFDTIEHLLHREIALLRMCDNLTPNGVLLLSTPCGRQSSRLNPAWEHHKIEYGYLDLYKFLSRFFKRVIYPQHQDFQGKEIWREINRDEMRYMNKMNPLICEGPLYSAEVPAEALGEVP